MNIMVGVCTHTKSLVDQWNKIKNPNMSIHNFGHLVFNKEAGKHTLEKETTFKTGQQENWMSKYSRMKLDPNLSPCRKAHFK